ncbi:unnamed protein product [Absidia cylindrospora]
MPRPRITSEEEEITVEPCVIEATTPNNNNIILGNEEASSSNDNDNITIGELLLFLVVDESGRPVSPIASSDPKNANQLLDAGDSFTSYDYHPTRRYSYTFENIEPWKNGPTP